MLWRQDKESLCWRVRLWHTHQFWMLENRPKGKKISQQFSRAEQLNPIKMNLGTAEELCTSTGPPATHLKNSPVSKAKDKPHFLCWPSPNPHRVLLPYCKMKRGKMKRGRRIGPTGKQCHIWEKKRITQKTKKKSTLLKMIYYRNQKKILGNCHL